MISKVAAGGGAAALTAFAIGVSLRHGIFVAGLAFVGGFVSPAIIGSETPNTPVLFGYLLAIAAGTLGGHPASRLVAARAGACWRARRCWTVALDAGDRAIGRELHWVGLFLVALAGLFVWATWRRMREQRKSAEGRRGAGLGGAGRHRRAAARAWSSTDGGQQKAGWLALALHGAGVFALGRWTPRFQYAAGLAPAPVARGAGAVVGRHRAARRPTGSADRFAWLTILFGGSLCRRRPSRCCGTPAGRASGRRFRWRRPSRTSCSAGTCCAARVDGRAVGPDQRRPRRALPGRRRAARALARTACPAPPRRWASWRPASPSSSPPPSRSSSAASGSRSPTPIELAAVAAIAAQLDLRGHAPALLAAARGRGRALRAQSRGAEISARA